MSDKRLAGKWQGQYTLGEGYSESQKGQSWGFTILMQIEGNGRVTGKCFDGEVSAENEAVIEGSIMNGNIDFIKKYRHHWEINDEGGVTENEGRESHEVIYTGRYQNNVFSGEWKIVTPIVYADGNIREQVLRGYWVMHKEF
jgi:hypothetical protein